MEKPIWKSKTMWGFGIAALIAVSQTLGIPVADTLVAKMVEVLSAFYGIYGARDAIGHLK